MLQAKMAEAGVERRRFTVEEYYRLAEAGILTEEDRVELIEGEIVRTVPIGSSYQSVVDRIAQLLWARSDDRCIVRVQGPVRLGPASEPDPDLALRRPREDFYSGAHLGPRDALVLFEVSGTSLEYDRRVKLPLYAGAGVAEVWLVDLEGRMVEVHAGPREGASDGVWGGRYRSTRAYSREESARSEVVEGLVLTVGEILV